MIKRLNLALTFLLAISLLVQNSIALASGGSLSFFGWAPDGSANWVQAATGGNIIFNKTDGVVLQGADTGRLLLYGGSALSNTNGASLDLNGSSFAGAGNAVLATSVTAGASITYNVKNSTGTHIFKVNGNTAWTFGSAGTLIQDATNGSALIMSVAQTSGKGVILGASSVNAEVVSGVGDSEIFTFNTGNYANVALEGLANTTGVLTAFLKSRKTDGTGDTIVQSGDKVSQKEYYGANGTGFSLAGYEQFIIDGTPGASADMPGAFVWFVSPDGSSTPAQAMKLGNDKKLTLSGIISVVGQTGASLIGGTDGYNIRNNANSQSVIFWDNNGNTSLQGGVTLSTAAKTITVTKGGAAATSGTFVCNGVTGVVVSTSSASANMVLAFSPNAIAGTAPIGSPYVSAFSAATSFTVKCSIAGETSTYNWAMINLQ